MITIIHYYHYHNSANQINRLPRGLHYTCAVLKTHVTLLAACSFDNTMASTSESLPIVPTTYLPLLGASSDIWKHFGFPALNG
jgi:hypothetical protein